MSEIVLRYMDEMRMRLDDIEMFYIRKAEANQNKPAGLHREIARLTSEIANLQAQVRILKNPSSFPMKEDKKISITKREWRK